MFTYGFRIIRNCYVGCGGRRRFWQSRHVHCAHRERRVECERGKSRTNRTRRRGQYSRSKRLSSLLLHNMYATAYYTIVRPYRYPTRRRTPLFSLYGQHPRRRSWGLLPKTPILSEVRVKYLLFILQREQTDSLYLTKTVCTYISFLSKFERYPQRRLPLSERENKN